MKKENKNDKETGEHEISTPAQNDKFKNKIGTSHDNYNQTNLDDNQKDNIRQNKINTDKIQMKKDQTLKSFALLDMGLINSQMKKYKFRDWTRNDPQFRHFRVYNEYDVEGNLKIPTIMSRQSVLNRLLVTA